MRLFIAEKPSVARTLAAALGADRRGDGYLFGNDYAVTWCLGHLLEQAQPEHYNPEFKRWALEHLPIAPEQWALVPRDNARKQLKVIQQLLNDAADVVNAGDPDNEGQLLVDEVLEQFKNRRPVLRFWASAQDDHSVREALRAMRDNRDFRGMRDAALARQRADWLIGMNFSRAFTLQHRARGGEGVISVGRVQTPTLQMVADRDAAIANFKPVPFFVLQARIKHANGEFSARWKPGKQQAGLDAEGRLLDASVAQSVMGKVNGQGGAIVEYSTQRKAESHPKGLSLTGLTLLASRAFGYGAAQVLEIAQALYETHKLASYPRTDCEYMPLSQHGAAREILAAIGSNLPGVAGWVEACDPALRSKLWDDSKITAHHAIVPTGHRCNAAGLSEAERNVYQLIARAYIAQFFPLHEYLQTTVLAACADEHFAASGRTVLVDGWKQLYASEPKDGDPDDPDQVLPEMRERDPVSFESVQQHERKTKPPARFTEATLIVAMENIHKYIEDEADKRALRDGDGIGTPATRASIVAELQRRGFLALEKKYVVSTDAGRAALGALPVQIRSAALTAQYQRQLKDIEAGALGVDHFVRDQVAFIASQINTVRGAMPEQVVYECPGCGTGELRRVRRRDGRSYFWSCSRWREDCRFTDNDQDGRPASLREHPAATS